MLTQATYRYLFILCLSIAAALSCGTAVAQSDSVATDEEQQSEPARKKYVGGHQLLVGVDVFNIVLNNYIKNKYSYEGEIQYYLKNEYYGVLEGGWGGSNVDFTDLKYTTTNSFARIGFNKSILYRESPSDWDMMFVGFRAGAANVNRSAANYYVADSVWGAFSGVTAPQNFMAVWAEITAGMRVELFRGLMAGWNVRGKFLMNGKSFNELAPLHIAGFGKGDKNANFDLNLFVSYAIRWNRVHAATEKKE
jgi:hypothetical protein